METKDVTLLTIAAAKGEPLSPVQLQKALFLIARAELPDMPKPLYNFQPYHYGPFDVQVYEDAKALEQEELVARVRLPGQTWVSYCLVPAAAKRIRKLESTLSEKSQQYINEVVTWVRSLSFPELLRAIYAQFPEFRKDSVFQE